MDLPQRKPNRLREYDYSKNGAYFLTLCVKDRRNLLGNISVGDGVLDVPPGAETARLLNNPLISVSKYGEIVNKYMSSIDATYEYISINKYVIMPNHIHMIVFIERSDSGTSRTPSPTNAIIPRVVSTLKRFSNKEIGFNIWQRSYHDHIIRNDEDYLTIWDYIDTNPQKWEEDCFYTA